MAKALNSSTITSEVFLRRAINANLRLGDQASAERLTQFIANTANPIDMRMDAMWALGYWENPPVLDRVEGRYRQPAQTNLTVAQTTMVSVVNKLLGESTREIKASTTTLIGRLKLKGFDDKLFYWVEDYKQPVEIRIAALGALAKTQPPQLERAMNTALASTDEALRQEAQSLLGELDLEESTVVKLLTKALENGSIGEQQKALLSLSAKKSNDAEILLGKWMDKLVAGQVDPALQLDVLTAIEKSNFESLKAKARGIRS